MDFSRVAPIYRWMEYFVFGNALQKRRCAFLRDVSQSKNVLLLGDGDGRFASAFLQAQQLLPETSVYLDFVDCSAGMVRLAEQRIRKLGLHSSVVRFRLDDARSTSFSGPYDLVVSHFFLDCFSTLELHRLVPRIAAATAPRTLWLVSEFAVPPRGNWKQIGRILIRVMYLFFRFTTRLKPTELPDYQGALAASGFRLHKVESALGGLIVSQLWSKTLP